MNDLSKFTVSNSDAFDFLVKSLKNKCSDTLRVYYDGCWWIDFQVSHCGNTRFFVGYEDKRSMNSNGSVCTVYDNDGKIDCACDFVIKPVVKSKVISLYNYIKKFR